MKDNSLTCKKCGTHYENAEDGFYWNKSIGWWRRPCKKCISAYNKQPKQYARRLKAIDKYRKTPKGKAAYKRYKENRMKKYWSEKRKLDK